MAPNLQHGYRERESSEVVRKCQGGEDVAGERRRRGGGGKRGTRRGGGRRGGEGRRMEKDEGGERY